MASTTNPIVFKLLATLPKAPALLSIAGSSSIIYAVVTNRQRRKMTYHRIMACLSFSDVVLSIAMFLGTWMIPPDPNAPFIYMAAGTQATCDAQGFLVQSGQMGVFLYQIVLAVYYVIEVRQEWRAKRVRRVEMICHAVVCVVSLGLATAGIPLQLYNNFLWFCYVNGSPLDCHKTDTCVRGKNAWIYQWAWYHGVLYLSFVAQIVSLLLIYCKVRQTEARNDRYMIDESPISVAGQQPSANHASTAGQQAPARYIVSVPGSQQAPTRHSRQKSDMVLGQAVLYGVSFLITFTPMIISQATAEITKTRRPKMVLPIAFLVPLQGFWNYIIYKRPAFVSFRRRNPEASFCRAVYHMISSGKEQT